MNLQVGWSARIVGCDAVCIASTVIVLISVAESKSQADRGSAARSA